MEFGSRVLLLFLCLPRPSHLSKWDRRSMIRVFLFLITFFVFDNRVTSFLTVDGSFCSNPIFFFPPGSFKPSVI